MPKMGHDNYFAAARARPMYDLRKSTSTGEFTLTIGADMRDSTHARPVYAEGTVALWLTGLAFTAIHVAFSGRYGFHRDELLSYSNAMHLDWCYVVYAPLTAWLARAELVVFGTSLVGYRLLPAVSVGLVSVLAGLIARAMGGGKGAMLVAAVAAGIAGPICFAGSFLSYMSFDILWWVLVAWATARLLRDGTMRAGGSSIGAGIGLGAADEVYYRVFCGGPAGGYAADAEPPIFSLGVVLVWRRYCARNGAAGDRVAIPASFCGAGVDEEHSRARRGGGE